MSVFATGPCLSSRILAMLRMGTGVGALYLSFAGGGAGSVGAMMARSTGGRVA